MQLAARMYALLEDVKRLHGEKTVLPVSHGAVCRMIRRCFQELTNDGFTGFIMPNCRLPEYAL